MLIKMKNTKRVSEYYQKWPNNASVVVVVEFYLYLLEAIAIKF